MFVIGSVENDHPSLCMHLLFYACLMQLGKRLLEYILKCMSEYFVCYSNRRVLFLFLLFKNCQR
jgi:hypothetical protein